MNYLYHRVPENMEGDILYPLNRLKEVYPKIYKKQIKKYEGREYIMDQTIPYLDCLWNDVLHFTAVNPKKTMKALEEARGKPISTKRFYQIKPELLEPENTIVYLSSHEDRSKRMSKNNFKQYNPKDIKKLSILPKETKEYYKEMFKKGERPLIYIRVPHILYKGSLDTKDLSIIKAQNEK